MTTYTLRLPQGFENYALEVESKGWFAEARLEARGKQYRLTFYDPARLAQEIHAQLQRGGVFFEPNLLVVPAVTRENMQKALDVLRSSTSMDSMVPE